MARLHGTKDMWLASMRDEGGAFGSAAAEADLASAVPSCPDWTIADLIHHLGSVYRWVHAHVVRGVTTKPDRSRLDFEAEPPGRRPDQLVEPGVRWPGEHLRPAGSGDAGVELGAAEQAGGVLAAPDGP